MPASSKPLRLVFAGTPEFAASHLQALINSNHEILAAYTQPDRPAGRGKKLTASPVKKLAGGASVPVCQPASLKDADTQAALAQLEPDAIIVVAYGLLLPQAVLDIPRFGCINVHASLLPRWRGAAPIQRAIEAGDTQSGVTIMQMEAGLDTGPMLATGSLPINPDMDAGQLHDALIEVGVASLLEVLEDLPQHLASASVQDDSLACYAHKIEKAEAELDWSLEAPVLHRKIRAFNPFPVAWTRVGEQRLKVWSAELAAPGGAQGSPGEIILTDDSGITLACGTGSLRLTRLQLPGGKPLEVSQLLRSRDHLFSPGLRLGG
jgi:methionyl-tRNA formyltransferase